MLHTVHDLIACSYLLAHILAGSIPLRQNIVFLVNDGFPLLFHFQKVSVQSFRVETDALSFRCNSLLDFVSLVIIPGGLLLQYISVTGTPQFAKLVELLYLRVLYLDDTVLAGPHQLRLSILRHLAAATTARPRAKVTMVLAHEQ